MANETTDVIHYAAQIGRLDFVSALLASIGIIMVFSGIIAFLNIRARAEMIAKQTAREETEKAANKYLQNNLPDILASYDDFIRNHIEASVADNIAASQENGNDHI